MTKVSFFHFLIPPEGERNLCSHNSMFVNAFVMLSVETYLKIGMRDKSNARHIH